MSEPNQTLTAEEVASPPLVETPNPNEAGERNPGDPTISLNPDGTVANSAAKMAMTVTPNPNPTPQSDPAFVPSPYQPEPAPPEGEARERL